MGEGVTNLVGGAASTSSSTTDSDPSPLLLHDTSFHILILLSVTCIVVLHWILRRGRRSLLLSKQSISPGHRAPDLDKHFDGGEGHLIRQSGSIDTHPGTSECNVYYSPSECDSFDLNELYDAEHCIVNQCGDSITKSDCEDRSSTEIEPDVENWTSIQCPLNPLPDSNIQCPVDTLPGSDILLDQCPVDTLPDSNILLDQCLVDTLPDTDMDSPENTSTVPDTPPDSFFTWDSGGSSGEYSFVHTAVELPKYPNGAITEEERQMLLLYMQTGHPELLLSSSNAAPTTDLCDPVAVRGFLETIVEENSDDLRSPSECDETSLGWGSWDDEDEDRLTVVEMVTASSNEVGASEPVYKTAQTNGYLSEVRSENLVDISDQPPCERQQIDVKLTGETSVAKCDNVNDVVAVEDINVLPPSKMDIGCGNKTKGGGEPGVSPVLSCSRVGNGFDTLWISGLESPSATINPWIMNNFSNISEDSINAFSDMDFSENEHIAEGPINPLLVLGSDDICLIPSSSISQNFDPSTEENLMFSDNFRDYFLPAESYAMGFNKHELDKNENDLSADPPKPLKQKNLKCFRIGFDSVPTEEQSFSNMNDSLIDINNDMSRSADGQENLICPENENSAFDSMFSPVKGDVVYGSTWAGSSDLKEQEKVPSGAEAHSPTIESDIRCEWSIRPESSEISMHRRSIPFLDQPLSDDEVPLPNSLSRWGHHTDLQHLQEGTSPLTRWQHQDLSKEEPNKPSDSEGSDDGLPHQLKEIYSSFKMRDNKMGRIRIKEDKNNNFKKLGLWDKEAKVTLPPFASEKDNNAKQKGGSREELDDLEFDMFASLKSAKQAERNGDSDIDDALKGFNHLDDYSSHSDDSSENESKYVVNIRKQTKSAGSMENTDHSSLEMPNETADVSPEIPSCSDNSDNCPLCTNTDFKNSHADLFALETNPGHGVQCLLQKTYPQMVGLNSNNNQSSSSDPEIHELNTDVSKTSDSISPLTSSDSDEGVRIKEVKKRLKKRPKENTNSELKHDDSGYVEEDEDEDEDSLEEQKEKNLQKSQILSEKESRKSLSTTFLESKSTTPESTASNFAIPETFQKFSEQLELSLSNEELKSEFLNAGKWNVPDNLSQFSAWLLDKELKKISSREEMEKLLVDDIISLREQTITNFLKICPDDEKEFLKSSDILKYIKLQDANEKESIKSNHAAESDISATKQSECKSLETRPSEEITRNHNNAISTQIKSATDQELSDEYYAYNFNPKVSKIFEQSADQIETVEKSGDNSNTSDNENLKPIEQNDNCLNSNDNNNLETIVQKDDCLYSNDSELKPDVAVTINETNINAEIEAVTYCFDNCDSPVELKPLTDDASSDQPSLLPSGSETTREIQLKVNDTTNPNRKIKIEAAPSNETDDYQNINTQHPSVEETTQSVATSIDEVSSYSTELVGVDRDLLTQRALEEKGRNEGEADDIGVLEGTHVRLYSCHTHPTDGALLIVTPDSEDSPPVHDKTLINDPASHSVSGEIETGVEEVVCLPEPAASVATHEERAGEEARSEFTTPDCTDKIIQKQVAEYDAGELVALEISQREVGGSLISADSEDLDIAVVSKIPFANDSCKNSQIVKSIDEKSVNGADTTVPCVTAPDIAATPDVPSFRAEYKRSNSLGRDSGETGGTFELWSGQSKSTPDLRRCHEQQNRSSAPLSALLSKSVSQRIEDYLVRNSRDDRLNKSLPPNERSRHYRRICVSTETVVERAARFEARSKSTREQNTEQKSRPDKRSGSCPPSSMRGNSNTGWISERNYRNYNKPTATVRPTIDVHRNRLPVNGVEKAEKEDLVELITGYTRATKVTHKPPVHPTSTNIHQSLKTVRLKGKIANARKDFFERLSQQDLSKEDESQDKRETENGPGLKRFDDFRKSAREERARMAASHPDLGALEAAVRSSKRKIDQLKKKKRKSVSQPPPLDAGAAPMPATKDLCLPYRRATGEIAWASCAKRVQDAKSKSKSAREQLEIVDVDSCLGKNGEVRAHPDSSGSAIAAGGGRVGDSCEFFGTRARSMDFLLDADNRERVQPPENRLGSNRVKSEHELRIERSLQNLTVPDWYKQSAWNKGPKEGFILRRGSEGSAGESRKRWQGLSSNSRTPSTTSLSTPPVTYSSQRIIIPRRGGDWRSLVSSRESLTPASPASLSPRECASAAFQYGLNSSLSRWSSSRLSTSSAPLTALSVHRSFRQPYLGWRAAAASSGGASRSSPGVSPVSATTPLQGSRPGSPRRGSQDQHYAYGLQQNQITCAATLRPEGPEPTDLNRISPLALNTTNIFFNSNADSNYEAAATQQQQQPPRCFNNVEMRRDRYSYTQSLYSGTVIVSPCDDESFNVDHHHHQIIHEDDTATEERFRIVRSPQPPPRLWMESSFVGTKKESADGASTVPAGRTIRIVPSDAAARSGQGVGTGSVRGGTCATQQTTMGSVPTNRKPAFSLKSIHV